ncbi:MAG: PEPxxWA-CTERM sorting domain-containing protein [Xanthobacteraceae bacterium]|nr:PEPxxWA-CTERM sorting domain-containing protein [Xanthobacteraceae bacterium]
MINRISALAAIAACTLGVAVSPAMAETWTYDLSPYSGQTFGSAGIQIANPVDAVTLTQANSAPYSFAIGPNGGLFSNIDGGAGTVVTSAGSAAGVAPASLTLTFATPVQGISFNFANSDFFGSDGKDTLTATINGTTVATATAAFPSNGDLYAEGSFFYTNPNGFTSITLTSTDGVGPQDLVIGDLTAAVPEPSTWAMLVLGFAGVGFMAYRRKSKATLLAA